MCMSIATARRSGRPYPKAAKDLRRRPLKPTTVHQEFDTLDLKETMDEVMATSNLGDGAPRKFLESLKDALDPNSIMAPGKSGIWGKRFRARSNEASVP